MLPQLVPGRVGSGDAASIGGLDGHSAGKGDTPQAEATSPPSERFLLQLTIGKSTREKLRYAQALLSHAVPSGDVAQVLDRALDALIVEMEKRKLGAGSRRQPQQVLRRRLPSHPRPDLVCPPARSRYVPAPVRRAVWERDQGQCTFVSTAGHRCESRRFLEFDHIDPVARGGRATVEGMRLRCRAHNQYEAERTFGTGFMTQKRHDARLAARETRMRAEAWAGVARMRAAAEAGAGVRAEAEAGAACNMPRGMLEVIDAKERAAWEQVQDVLAGLRNLGYRAHEARRAIASTETIHGVTLEERMRAALSFLGRG